MTTQATKRPWLNNPEYEGTLIKSEDGQTICEIELPRIRELGYDKCAEIQSANARLIVHCVNVHDELIETLKYALDFANEGYPKYDQITVRMKIEQALKKAEA